MKPPVCEEMKKLRNYLDAHKIAWEDASTDTNKLWICRTHFYFCGNFYSVINGYGTYGGYNDISNKENEGLLELYGYQFSDPIGYLTADEVVKKIDDINNIRGV